ncbi:DNA polymerase III subunit delta' [Corynebacterium fournieri]|uniref:DNA polymerase III subunit delta' n=1 Tax=Corynebacterium fournieri TaxID=1852390 RepID=UPI000A2F3E38|nr:DNA polymerase III subunit delta' [Corynebacterium fournieri]WJY96620.1 DNA polymerase III subunit tau [Corynebacterium fournieri]
MTTRSVSERLAGTPAVRDTIMSAAKAARLGDGYAMTHAWLFTGPPGAGRSQAALAFAAALMCTDPDEIGCGRCEACHLALAGTHTDLLHVVPQRVNIPVEYVRRTIVPQAARLPTVAPWRVIIIENADRLNTDAADALLKTVEEPPEHTVIIMCAPSTDPQDFSQTLRSRCRHLYVPAPTEDEVVRILVDEEGASEHDARLAAAATMRHVGRARLLVRSEKVQQRRSMAINLAELVFHGAQAFQAVGALVKAAESEAVEAHKAEDEAERAKLENALGMGAKGKGAARALGGVASSIKALEEEQKKRGTRRKRDMFDLVLVDLAGVYRDAMIIQSGADLPLIHPDYEGLAREIAERTTADGLVECQEAIAQCRLRLAQQVQPAVAFNGMLGRIRLACNVR